MSPFFSIIIPLYNKEKYIKRTIDTVLFQTFQDFEVIIVNDGSTDNSVALIKQYNDNRIQVKHQKNEGVSSAKNTGINLAKGQYIALLDADDQWHENHLEALKEQIDCFPNAGLYCNNYEIVYDNNTVTATQFNFKYENKPLVVGDFFKASTFNWVAWTSAIAFPKSTFKTIKGFNTALDTYEDLDFYIKIALRYNIIFNPKVTMIYYANISNSLTKQESNTNRLHFINSYKSEEKDNKSLKCLLDINRYALAIRCKILGNKKIYNSVIQQIDYQHLNLKQKVLLICPRGVLLSLKKIQVLLLKNNIYLSAFR